MSVNLGNSQICLLDQLLPLRSRPLFPPKLDRHGDVLHSRVPVYAKFWKHHFVNQDARLWTHGSYHVLKNLYAKIIRPVMKDSPEVVEIGIFAISV
jgi:hypothetical protein